MLLLFQFNDDVKAKIKLILQLLLLALVYEKIFWKYFKLLLTKILGVTNGGRKYNAHLCKEKNGI